MTHSEVANVNRKPGPTDLSAGVMTPHEKESDMSVRLAQRARKTLGTLFNTVYRVTREKKDHQTFAVTNSNEFKEVITLTHLCSSKEEHFNKAAESTESLTREIRSQGRGRQTLSSRWFELIGPSQASML